jgi:hypothetical protein
MTSANSSASSPRRRLLRDAEQPDAGQAGGGAGEAHRGLQREGRREDHVAHDRVVTSPAMKVVFLACSYPPEMQQYTRGLAEVGAEVYGVGDTAAASLAAQSLKRHLTDYLQVPRLLDEDDVVERVYQWLRGRERRSRAGQLGGHGADRGPAARAARRARHVGTTPSTASATSS